MHPKEEEFAVCSFPASRRFLKFSRQCASTRVGFVLILLIMLRLDCTHTRLMYLRAANSNSPAVVPVVASVSLFLSSLFCLFASCKSLWRVGAVWFACPVSVAGLAWRVGGCLCFVLVPLSLLSLPPACRYPVWSAWLLSFLLPLGR